MHGTESENWRKGAVQNDETVKPNDDTDRRWKYGIWLGTVEHTGEHIIGTKEGTIKCRAIAQLTPDRKYDAEFLDKIRGTPWKPSPKHNTWKLRTNLDGDEDHEEVADDEFKVCVDFNEDVDEAMKIIKESKRILEKKNPTVHGFHITQADIIRYGTTSRCNGCRFAMGKVSYQQAHSPECRKRILRLMREEPQDRWRVERWDQDHQLAEDEVDEPEITEPRRVTNNDDDHDEEKRRRQTGETSQETRTGERDENNADRPQRPQKRKRKDWDEEMIRRIEEETGIRRDYDPDRATSSTTPGRDKRKGEDQTPVDGVRRDKIRRTRLERKKRGREEEEMDDRGEDGMSEVRIDSLNLANLRCCEGQDKNDLIKNIKENDYFLITTCEGNNDDLNTLAHRMQREKGKHFVHFQRDGRVTTNSYKEFSKTCMCI